MSTMLEAMKRAGLVSEVDVERAKAADRAEADARLQAERFTRALTRLDPQLLNEMRSWEKDEQFTIPPPVLLEWAELDYHGQLREWAKWLAAYADAKAKVS